MDGVCGWARAGAIRDLRVCVWSTLIMQEREIQETNRMQESLEAAAERWDLGLWKAKWSFVKPVVLQQYPITSSDYSSFFVLK